MKIIIAGAGQVGTTLAESLCHDHDITVIDLNAQNLKRLTNRLDLHTILGSASWPHILDQANASDADMIIAVTDNDECNVVTCLIAKTLFKIPTKIARIRYPQLEHYQYYLQAQPVIDMVINPAKIITERLVQQIENPGAQMVLDFGPPEAEVKLASFKVTLQSHLIGRKLLEIYHDLNQAQAVILGVLRDSHMLSPQENMLVQALDEIYFACRPHDLSRIIKEWSHYEERFRRIMIAGAGYVGVTLAQQLENRYQVKLLDCDKTQCEKAVSLLHNTLVLYGDASDTDLLISEKIQEIDLFCAITNDDEANIMAAIIAKRLGAKHNIVLVNRETYSHYLVENSPDIDMAISPQRITGGCILKYLRQGDLVNTYSLPRGNAEAIEVIVHGDASSSKIVGKALQAIPFSKKVVIAAIIRKNQVLLAEKELIVQENDHLVIFITDQSCVRELEKLIKVSENKG